MYICTYNFIYIYMHMYALALNIFWLIPIDQGEHSFYPKVDPQNFLKGCASRIAKIKE